ncbi:MAG: hypothetical protein Q4C56_02185 [Peptococcaceae bacterium]|nr:hypothetical protein [Peptococcaceae bacterium]
MPFLKRRRRYKIVRCDDARKRVLLTSGYEMVCPDDADFQETLEEDPAPDAGTTSTDSDKH